MKRPSKESLSGVLAALAASLCFAAVIFGPGFGGPSASDERLFHRPAVEGFVAQWPRPDLSDYPAASAPGHLLHLAALEAVAGVPLELQRLVSGLPIAAAFGALVWWSARRVGIARGLVLALPFVLSPYVFAFGVLAIPEGWGWGLLAVLLLLLSGQRVGLRTLLVAGLVLAMGVWCRQITLWAAGLIWLAGWLIGQRDRAEPGSLAEPLWPGAGDRAGAAWSGRLMGLGVGLLATLPAIGLVAWMVSMWGGLVPPSFATAEAAAAAGGAHSGGGNPAVPAFTAALFAVFGGAALPAALPALVRRRRAAVRAAGVGAAIGLTLAIAVPTTYDMDAGRWSGLWNIAARLPAPAERSPIIAGMAAAGGAVAGVLLFAVQGSRTRWMFLAAIVGFTLAQSFNAQAFQRYIEPMLLLLAAMAAAAAHRAEDRRPPWWCLAPTASLALALAALTAGRLGGS